MSRHGAKSQKKTGKKFILILLSIVSVVMIMMALKLIANGKNYTVTNNQFEVLKKSGYFKVEIPENVFLSGELIFDIAEKELFGDLKAIKDGEAYGLYVESSVDDTFTQLFDDRLSILKRLELSNKEIEDAGFQIERNVLPLLDQNEFEKEIPGMFEEDYLIHGLKKVRITYNKEFLPTKIEGYFDDEGDKKWELMRKISYPYKNQKEFEKELDEHIELIEDVEREESDN